MHLSKKQAIGAKQIAEIACRYVKMVKWSIPSLRIFFRNILTKAKAKLTRIITKTGFHIITLYFSLFVCNL